MFLFSGWTVPVAAGIGGVLVLVIVILVIIMCRRKKNPQNLSPIDEQVISPYGYIYLHIIAS